MLIFLTEHSLLRLLQQFSPLTASPLNPFHPIPSPSLLHFASHCILSYFIPSHLSYFIILHCIASYSIVSYLILSCLLPVSAHRYRGFEGSLEGGSSGGCAQDTGQWREGASTSLIQCMSICISLCVCLIGCLSVGILFVCV